MPLLSPIYPLLLSVFILAEAPPPGDPASYQSVGWLLLAAAGLAGAVNQFLSAAVNARKLRSPGPEETETDAKIAALGAEVRELERRLEQRLEQRMGEHLGAISKQLGTMETTLTQVVRDFNYAVGVIDGKSSQ